MSAEQKEYLQWRGSFRRPGRRTNYASVARRMSGEGAVSGHGQSAATGALNARWVAQERATMCTLARGLARGLGARGLARARLGARLGARPGARRDAQALRTFQAALSQRRGSRSARCGVCAQNETPAVTTHRAAVLTARLSHTFLFCAITDFLAKISTEIMQQARTGLTAGTAAQTRTCDGP